MIVCNLKPKDSIVCFISDSLRQLEGVEGEMSAIKIIFILVWLSNEHRSTPDKNSLKIQREE